MDTKSLFVALLMSASIVAACSDDTETNECTTAEQCGEGFICNAGQCEASQATNNVATDAGGTSNNATADSGDSDANNVSSDSGNADPDLGPPDMGEDAGPMFPEPLGLTSFETEIPILVRGATSLGTGVLAVGTTPGDFAQGESREGLAVYYQDDGSLGWAARFGDPSNDQFADAVSTQNGALLVGVTRGYSVTTQNNNDALLVQATATGLGAAANWGTPENELLFGVFPGGSLATWIGVGEMSGAGGERDGLIIGFDTSLEPTFAVRLNAGADDFLTDGVVVDSTLYVVGSTGVQGDPTSRRALVASLEANGVNWTRRGAQTGTSALAVYDDPNSDGVVVAGGFGGPAELRFSPAGDVRGQVWNVPDSYTASAIEWGATRVIHGVQNTQAPFVMTVGSVGEGTVVRMPETLSAPGFLPTPVVQTASTSRIVVQSASQELVDVPYTGAPQTLCDEATDMVSSSPLPAGAFEAVPAQRTDVTLSGGTILSPRTSVITAPRAALECQP